jgi:hypothetical protein
MSMSGRTLVLIQLMKVVADGDRVRRPIHGRDGRYIIPWLAIAREYNNTAA